MSKKVDDIRDFRIRSLMRYGDKVSNMYKVGLRLKKIWLRLPKEHVDVP